MRRQTAAGIRTDWYAGRDRERLNQAGIRRGLHGTNQLDNRRTTHDAVGVEDDHEVVAGTRTPAELCDVARLATDIARSAPIVQPSRLVQLPAQTVPRPFLRTGDAGVGRVTQQVEIEVDVVSGRAQRPPHRTQPVHDARGILVVDRHDERRARRDRFVCIGTRSRALERQGIATAQHEDETEHGIPEGDRDPSEHQGEQQQDDHLQKRDAVVANDREHHADADRGRRGRQPEEQPAPQPKIRQMEMHAIRPAPDTRRSSTSR